MRERAHERARERAHERAGTLSSHAGVRSACQSFCNKFSFYVTQNQRKGGRGAGGRETGRPRQEAEIMVLKVPLSIGPPYKISSWNKFLKG